MNFKGKRKFKKSVEEAQYRPIWTNRIFMVTLSGLENYYNILA